MKHLSFALLTLFGAHAAAAESVTYACDITKLDGHGWIAPEYFFQVDVATGSAKVASNHHDWTNARFKNRGTKGYRMNWNLTLPASAGGNLRVRYQANLDPTDNSVKLRMAFVTTNASNKPYGTGTCKVQ
ncbi:MAG: hypothetical protein AB3N07_07310 [Ruegeria sp.]|uniref:hypothetical protein n=1 Tax=Ruegeria sp. ANG-S4 TaxID=1577904 RepID=UPI0005804CBB|nr:hypothetical protein [Ruegeria sp. ANG-S4]KIC44005.1 hypothetical protein RA28_13450 [Ruegeria sp. ANG-S4]